MFVFIVSEGIASAGAQAHVSLDVDAAPHRPVVLRAAWRQARIPILVTSKLKQIEKLIGPTPAPAADGPGIASDMYDLLGSIKANGTALPEHARKLDQVMGRWYTAAQLDIAAATGEEHKPYKAPTVRYVEPASLDRPREARRPAGRLQWVADRMAMAVGVFNAAGARCSDWPAAIYATAATLATPPPCAADWGAYELAALTRSKVLVGSINHGPVEAGARQKACGILPGIVRATWRTQGRGGSTGRMRQ